MNKQVIKDLIGTEDPIFFEIGANNGSDTQEFLKLFTKGKFYCFEPDPRAFKKLRKNINDPRCDIYKCAISDSCEDLPFHLSGGWPPDWPGTGDWDMSSSLKKPKKHVPLHPWCTFNQTVTVKTITLDSFTNGHYIDHIDFIWADVQGNEEALIKGGLATLNDKTKYFYTEYSNEELYEGEIGLDKILDLLPDFEIMADLGTDALLKNRNL